MKKYLIYFICGLIMSNVPFIYIGMLLGFPVVVVSALIIPRLFKYNLLKYIVYSTLISLPIMFITGAFVDSVAFQKLDILKAGLIYIQYGTFSIILNNFVSYTLNKAYNK